MDLQDKRNSDIYSFGADFEQTLFHLEGGFALSDDLSLSVALPILTRSGGIMDRPLDDWHIFVGADRFRRHQFPADQNRFTIQKNGEERLGTNQASGLSHSLIKLKWWLFKKEESPRPEMEGLAISFQTRLPLRGPNSTLTTGNTEGSLLIHAGSRISSWAYFWFTAGFSKLSPNPIFAGWPTRQWSQLYEGWFEIPLGAKWDLVFQLRYESPLLDKEHLEFLYVSTDPKSQSAERAASGWNGLTAWRGSEAIGARYRSSEKLAFSLLFQEDWALGDNDGRKNFLYVHGSPDVAIIGNLYLAF